MRKLQQIIAQLPIADRAAFEANAFPEYADVAAVNLLATVLKAGEVLNSLAEDFKTFNQASDRHGHGFDGFGFDPNDMMFMGDEQSSQTQMGRQPKGMAGLMGKFFR